VRHILRITHMKFPFGKKRKQLSDTELEERLGRERLEALSLARFGSVMVGDSVLSGRLVADMMFRVEPDMNMPFSGWTVISSESPEDNIEMHDCLRILRVAPEVAQYLDLPPGTEMSRTGETTFEVDSDDAA
jgi:hypothetical protein